MPRTILVSNRLPVSVRAERGNLRVEPSAGGLATALAVAHEGTDALWIGWPGDVSRASADDVQALDRSLESGRFRPVLLSPYEVASYYDGFANGVLWPLLHYFLDKVDLDAQEDWMVYEAVNRRFAERAAELARPGDSVWIHDYQLALVPQLVRELAPHVRVGFFLHVPFPPLEVFGVLPWRRRVIAGIAGADLVGFHTESYARAFRRAAETFIDADRSPDGVLVDGRSVRIASYPIGIDANRFERLAKTDDVATECARIVSGARGRKVILGVDRLDYTKGIPRRLLAIERLLDESPTLREQLIFVQLAVPTREKVEAYASLRRQVNELVGRINARHGTATSSPVQLLYRSVSLPDLVALYRAADVMLVTPLRDGMNLVAKEYVASRIDDGGTLVLSEFAGAASELEGALVVNPYDVAGMTDAIRQALEMAPAEQGRRMRRLRECVRQKDIRAWSNAFLEDLAWAAKEPASGMIEVLPLAGRRAR